MSEDTSEEKIAPIIIVGNPSGQGKTAFGDEHGFKSPIMLIGALNNAHIHAEITRFLGVIHKDISNIVVVTPEEAADSNLPKPIKEHVKNRGQVLYVKDAHELNKDLPILKFEILTHTCETHYITSKKEVEAHPFNKFMKKPKTRRK